MYPTQPGWYWVEHEGTIMPIEVVQGDYGLYRTDGCEITPCLGALPPAPRAVVGALRFDVKSGQNDWGSEGTARRIGDLMFGSICTVVEKDNGCWIVGGSNNYWLYLTNRAHTYALIARYGFSVNKYMWLAMAIEDIFRARVLSPSETEGIWP